MQELPVFEKAVTALSMTLAATGGAGQVRSLCEKFTQSVCVCVCVCSWHLSDRGSHVGLASIDESEDLEELMQSAVEGPLGELQGQWQQSMLGSLGL